MVDAGKVAALATGSPKRSGLMPDVPTTLESWAMPNSDYNFWVGALVPAKTPRAIVDKLHADITALVESPEVSAADPQARLRSAADVGEGVRGHDRAASWRRTPS